MERPMIEGNKKKIKVVNSLNNPITPIGEFTTFDDPTETDKKSNIPAEIAAINKAKNKKIAK